MLLLVLTCLSPLALSRSPPTLTSATTSHQDEIPGGLTLELCRNSTSCESPRTCVDIYTLVSSDSAPCTNETAQCVCRPPTLASCTASANCTVGERCTTNSNFTGDATLNFSLCVSCEHLDTLAFYAFTNVDAALDNCADAKQSQSESDPCVAVDSLPGFTASQLVFAQHRRSAVLCDVHGNCATPGHFVVFDGVHMTMRRYCQVADGCRRTVKLVNSPKMTRGLRVRSKSARLQFTAFSARYGSMVEEIGIKLLLWAGL